MVMDFIPHRDIASFSQYLVRSLSSWTVTRVLPLKENPAHPWDALDKLRAFHVYSEGTCIVMACRSPFVLFMVSSAPHFSTSLPVPYV